MRKIVPCQCLVLVGLGLIWLSGCSNGDTVPLVPPSVVCERPLDPAWKDLNNICGGLAPRDAVWPPGRMPFVVGDRGLLLECESYSNWSVRDSDVSDDLYVVTANEDGALVAAGENGAVTVGRNGTWKSLDLPTQTTWRDARASGRNIWLAGDSGTLAVGIPGDSWQLVDFPGTNDLLGVCAFEDSVYVSGSEGMLKVLVDGQWHDRASPQWGIRPVESVVRLPDGRLVVLAAELYVREPEQWVRLSDVPRSYNFTGHLKMRDGHLWYLYGGKLVRLDPSVDPWEQTFFNDWVRGDGMAVGSESKVLRLTGEGDLIWQSPNVDGGVDNVLDPAGRIESRKLIQLNDGTIVIPARETLFQVTRQGIVRVPDLSAEIEDRISRNSVLAGQSLDDFYVYSNVLNHCRNGEILAQLEIPVGQFEVEDMVVDHDGQICLSMDDGLLFWSENQWQSYPQEHTPLIFLTNHQTIVAVYREFAQYKTSNGLVPVDLHRSVMQVSEIQPGILEFIDRDYERFWWEKGTGASGTDFLDPLPGCGDISASASCETPSGTFFATYGHSMVLKLPNDVIRSDWELVAGPCMRQIGLLQVLEDGYLIAVDRNNYNVMIHPPSGL
jgi:hypothetical protein